MLITFLNNHVILSLYSSLSKNISLCAEGLYLLELFLIDIFQLACMFYAKIEQNKTGLEH